MSRVAVIGAGSFGRNHLRVLRQLPNAELAGVYDTDPEHAARAAQEFGCPLLATLPTNADAIDAAIVATPTVTHAGTGCALLEAGLDVLVEKPIAHDLASAQRLADAAARGGRILQVGHLERFNPAVAALRKMVRLPLFFEVHRMSVFTPRSLDVDVVADLMIHDIDLVLDMVGQAPSEIRAAGICVLSGKVDIANVRLAFPGGCIANLTASRVSTERIRKMRLFQPRQYISLDYQRQEAVAFTVSGAQHIGFDPLPVVKDEPLRLEVAAFLDSVATRSRPAAGAAEATAALEVTLGILAKIEEHAEIVAESLLRSPA